LYELKNIVGVKDATGDLNRVNQQLKMMLFVLIKTKYAYTSYL